MSVLQRFFNTVPKEKQAEGHTQVRGLDFGQAYNPYNEVLLLQHHSDIIRLLLKIDNKRFVSAGDDNKAVIWDIQFGRKLATLVGHSHPITSLLLLQPRIDSVDDYYLLTGSSDKQIKVWDVSTGQCRRTLTQHASSVRCLVSLMDRELFCSGGEHISVWNQNGTLLNTYQRKPEEEDIYLMIAISNYRLVTAADKDLVVYSVITGTSTDNEDRKEIIKIRRLPSHREAIHSLIVISDSCFSSGSIDGTIILWTSHNLIPARQFNTVSEYQGISKGFPFSVQSLFCVQERYLFAAIGSGFCVFDMGQGRERLLIRMLAAHHSKISHLGFACEGRYLVTCSEDGSIRIWGRPPLYGDDDEKEHLPQSPMEQFTGMSMAELQNVGDSLWSPHLLGECLGHASAVQSFLDYDHEGLVSCGADGLVIVWKNSEMQKVRRNQMVQDIILNYDAIV
ncbi:WD repeat-containing protein 41-like [Pomacea canaliculata]|uniref:WD repeat-containing protein 41-like n=1 Tax=Pomacea canaliculata TaxID=400727 RepID=UPI000D7378EA|nr:WD repeat-containing protein 41-like [Pomacea canaliculata]